LFLPTKLDIDDTLKLHSIDSFANYPDGLVDLPVNGITVTIMKSAVEAVGLLLLLLIIPVNPIPTVCGRFQSALTILLLPI
jgi:hypothetical protein